VTKPTLALDEDGDDYLLRKTDENGTASQMRLSGDDVLTLSQSSARLRQSILAKRTPASGGVTPVFATNVVQVVVAPDTLGEDILLSLVAPDGSQTVFALPPHIARLLVERLPAHLTALGDVKLPRQ